MQSKQTQWCGEGLLAGGLTEGIYRLTKTSSKITKQAMITTPIFTNKQIKY